MYKKKAVVIHSGGMDSSICLAYAIDQFSAENILSLSFSYAQRHSNELEQAKKICETWGVDHKVVNLDCLQSLTWNALTDASIAISHEENCDAPNTLVVGRNGLMARLGAIHANHLGAHTIFMGVIEVEAWNSGYRDCSRDYFDRMEEILRIDLDDPTFEICTPIVAMSKQETLEFAEKLGVLPFLLKNTITCYEGIPYKGCEKCPACELRNEGLRLYCEANPLFVAPY